MLATLIHIPANVGYAAVFALVAVETMGIPVPAETGLIAAALLAHNGQMDVVTLWLVASAAAILGDNVGFAIGRSYGRRVFLAPGPLQTHRRKVLELGEPFFEKHGPKAVFLGRWVSGLRIASAWLAGMNRMRWRVFIPWNALGGLAWAGTVVFSIYLLGSAAEHALAVVGPVAAAIVVVGIGGVLVWYWRRQRARVAVEARRTSAGA